MSGTPDGTIAKSKPPKRNLHFELYEGTVEGNLTNRSNPPYQRRADLLDPTSLLDRLAWLLHY